MPKQGKTPKKKSKEKTPQKSGESEYPEMDQDEFNRLFQNAIEQSQAQLQQKHEEQIKRLEADREALEERLTMEAVTCSRSTFGSPMRSICHMSLFLPV